MHQMHFELLASDHRKYTHMYCQTAAVYVRIWHAHLQKVQVLDVLPAQYCMFVKQIWTSSSFIPLLVIVFKHMHGGP